MKSANSHSHDQSLKRVLHFLDLPENMNILPKKRWHVRTKDNIARVRRDEAQAAEEEREKLRRAKLAEQEARTALLRQRARAGRSDNDEEQTESTAENAPDGEQHKDESYKQRPPEKDSSRKALDAFSRVQQTSATTADIYTKEGNINFFKDLEAGGPGTTGSLTNKEHEADEKAEKEKYEKQIGLLTYLGQDSLEASKSKAWYNDEAKCVSAMWSKAAERDGGAEEEKEGGKSTESLEVGLKYKKSQDPLNDVIKYTGWKPTKSSPVSRKEICSSIPDNVRLELTGYSRDNEVLAISDGKCDRKLKKMLKKRKKLDEQIRNLGGSSKQAKKKLKDKKRRDRRREKSLDKAKDERKSNKKSRRKDLRDCVKDDVSKGNSSKHKRRNSSRGSQSSDSDERPSRKRRHIEFRNKSCRRSRSKTSSSSSAASSHDSYTTDSEAERRDKEERHKQLERLRAERLAREAAERKRAQRLLSGLDPNTEPPPAAVPGAARQKYSAQFNPLVARQNKEPLRAGVKYF